MTLDIFEVLTVSGNDIVSCTSVGIFGNVLIYHFKLFEVSTVTGITNVRFSSEMSTVAGITVVRCTSVGIFENV